jgi:hypothetical protein
LRGVGLAVLLDDEASADLGDGTDDPEAATLQVEVGPAEEAEHLGAPKAGRRQQLPQGAEPGLGGYQQEPP